MKNEDFEDLGITAPLSRVPREKNSQRRINSLGRDRDKKSAIKTIYNATIVLESVVPY
jgi:hypothetical protein